jgi:hypothetical protein
MSNHTPLRAAAIAEAARAAGAIDATEIPLLIGPGDGTAAQRVAALKAAKPHLFRKDARDMTDAEFKAAKAGFSREIARQQAERDVNSGLARRLSKFQTTKDSQ